MCTRTYILSGDEDHHSFSVLLSDDKKSGKITWCNLINQEYSATFNLKVDEISFQQWQAITGTSIVYLVVEYGGPKNDIVNQPFSAWLESFMTFQRTWIFYGDKSRNIIGGKIYRSNNKKIDIIHCAGNEHVSGERNHTFHLIGDNRNIESVIIDGKENKITIIVNCVGEENNPVVEVSLALYAKVYQDVFYKFTTRSTKDFLSLLEKEQMKKI
jgi:hypothetical protein